MKVEDNNKALKKIRQEYSDKVAAAKLNKQMSAAYNNLTSENADPVSEEIRKMVIDLSDKGLLPQLASYTQQAMTISEHSKKS